MLYELHVTNFGRQPLTLQRVDVLDGRTDAVLAAFEGGVLTGMLSRPGTAGVADKSAVGPGLRAVVYVDLIQPSTSVPPSSLRHRLTFVPVVPPDAPLQSIVEGGFVVPSAAPAVVLGPPLRGDGWLASHGLSNDSSHRRTLLAIDGKARIAQRFAIDFTRIGADGNAFRGDPAKNANWTPYGADVLAVADGTVTDVQDGIPENDPTSDKKAVPITLTTVGGNYVLLDIGSGRFAFYAHLQPRSLRVRKGERVTRGQVLAKLGNSGQADAPHLHLHIVDGPSPLGAEGVPMVFDSFVLQGHVPSLRVLVDGTGWKPTEPEAERRREMPLENAVIRFP
jgi:hypothetical protein